MVCVGSGVGMWYVKVVSGIKVARNGCARAVWEDGEGKEAS